MEVNLQNLVEWYCMSCIHYEKTKVTKRNKKKLQMRPGGKVKLSDKTKNFAAKKNLRKNMLNININLKY